MRLASGMHILRSERIYCTIFRPESDFKVIELHWQLDTLIVPIFRFESDFKVIYLKIGSWIYKVCPVFPKRI